jgi:hypothetical protein
VALLVLRGVVTGVLTEVTLLTSALDLLRHLDAATSGEVVELGLDAVVRDAGQLRSSHRSDATCEAGRTWEALRSPA